MPQTKRSPPCPAASSIRKSGMTANYQIVDDAQVPGGAASGSNTCVGCCQKRLSVTKVRMGMWFEILLLAGLPAVAAGIGFAAGRLLPLRQDRKKQAAEQRLTSLASRFPGVIYRRIQEGSDSVLALHRMVGDGRIDLADMGRDLIDREHFEHWREAVLTSARDGSPFQVETRMQTPEGSRWVRSVAATRREDDGSVVWDGVLLDITDLKETEAALHKREMEYRLLADHSRDIISRHSADGTCTYVSPAATVLLGYRVEELIGASPFDFVHPDDVERLRAAHQRILDGALPAGCAYRIRHRDGSWLWIETHGSVVCNADTSETIQIVCVSRDVSDRQEAQEALHRSEERRRLAVAGNRTDARDRPGRHPARFGMVAGADPPR
jgi:PAS domain S-box-containing protein